MSSKNQDIEVVETTETSLSAPRKKSKLGYVIIIVLCIIYLINPSSGLLEAIPDVLPVVGNIDEAAITTALIWSIQKIRNDT